MITYLGVLLMLIAYDAFEKSVWQVAIPVYIVALILFVSAERRK